MTTSHDERQRLAAMGHTLRPDWPAGSLFALITDQLQNRSYRDIAIALAFIATDPTTRTPGRLKEHGPWWEAARPAATTTQRGNSRCDKCGIFHAPTSPCRVQDLPAHHRKPAAAFIRADLQARHGGAPAPTDLGEPE
jgi:hypothetical protein